MWEWWFMLCCNLLVPIVIIIGGLIMWKYPPRNINNLIGYRTYRSMKNMDTWIFAHKYCGKLWWKIGWITLFLSLVISMLFYGDSGNTIAIVSLILMTIQFIILMCSIISTERALKKTFTDDGILR